MKILSDGEVLAEYGDLDAAEPGQTIFGAPQSRIQTMLLRFDSGRVIRARAGVNHSVTIEDTCTQKLLFVHAGRLRADLYDRNRRPVDSRILGPGQFVICYSAGHRFEFLADDTRVLEVKSGPFLGDALDREFFEVDAP